MNEVVDGQALEVRHNALSLVPETTAADLVRRLDTIRDAMQTAMVEDVDFGKVPGTNKPTLLKPGAEKLSVLFQFDVQIENDKTWHDDGHLTVVSHATVYHAPSGARVAAGEGICTTKESKYAYRLADRFCPYCGVAAIIKGKAEYGGGWLCFKKKGGCGAKFPDAAPEIVEQPTGKVPNENLADTWNTVDKMATKRARIDAILAATGASALFTQDAEDLPRATPAAEPPRVPSGQASALLLDVEAGIARIGPTDPRWTLEAVIGNAAVKFGRPIAFLDELTEPELEQILAAMPAEPS